MSVEACAGRLMIVLHSSSGENSFMLSPAAAFHREIRGHGSGSAAEWRRWSWWCLAQAHMRSRVLKVGSLRSRMLQVLLVLLDGFIKYVDSDSSYVI